MLHVSLAAEPIWHIGSWSISNSLLTTWIGMGLLLVLVWLGTRRLSLVPNGLGQTIWEMLVEFFADLTEGVAGKKRGYQFLPLVMSLFLFIMTLNWLGLLPGVGTIGFHESVEEEVEKVHLNDEQASVETETVAPVVTENVESEAVEEHTKFVPLFRAGTADLNTTLALAIVAVVGIQYFALKNIGLSAHLHKFFNFSSPIDFFVGILELILEFAKIISFAFRLFGNIFAGEVLLAVIMFLIPVFVPLPFLGMEIFVGVIQAFVFAILTLVFLTIATEKHGH